MSQSPISNNIRKLRFFHDEMTQKELADQVGVTRQTIVAIEKAQYSPSLEVAFRIARVFDAPLEEVFIYSPEEDQALAKRARRSGATQAGQENQGS
ncbi:MAG: helix-turn-helix transcriptional regulator [Candidatus Promineofilum sp.]|jgi:putative transcriptional regulator|nr:helix-turn-helix transcriptional regulator [Promineifilum sp.]